MKYYIVDNWNRKVAVSRQKFYSFSRRKSAHVTVFCDSCGNKAGKILKFN